MDNIKIIPAESDSSVDRSSPEEKKKALKQKSTLMITGAVGSILLISIAAMWTGGDKEKERRLVSAGKDLTFDSSKDRNLWQDKTQQQIQDLIKAVEDGQKQNEFLVSQIEASKEKDKELTDALAKSADLNNNLTKEIQGLKEETDKKIREASLAAAKSQAGAPSIAAPSSAGGLSIPLPPGERSGGSGFKAPSPVQDPEGNEVPPPPVNPFAVIKGQKAKTPPAFKTASVNTKESLATADPVMIEEDSDGLLITGMPESELKKYVENAVKAEKKMVESDFAGYLPEGSFAEIAIISGLDSGASEDSQDSPMPVMMRVQSNATVPSMQGKLTYRIKGCFAVGSAYGDVSSERVLISPTRLSCVDAARGYVLSSKINGVITDFDSVNGLRGTVEYRDGAKLAKSILASTAGSIAQLAAVGGGVATSTISSGISYDDNGSLSLPSMGGLGASVGANALTSSAEIIAKRYAEQMNDIHPVIYLPPGRKGTLYLTEGVKLKWNSYDRIYQEEITPKDESITSGGILEKGEPSR